jgi:LmbE family N-acetylglucosaminyl deacetylase
VLLVIAHPDDETMFFTPAIADLQRRGCELFLLCCSTGA